MNSIIYKNLLLFIFAIAATAPVLAANGDVLLRDRDHTSPHYHIYGKTAEALFNAIIPDGTTGPINGFTSPAKVLLTSKLICRSHFDGAEYKYVCQISKYLSPGEIAHIFQHLNIEQITTNKPDRNVKIVGEIMILSSQNDNQIFYKHPCKNADTLIKAKKCMEFWAERIYLDGEDGNPSNVVVSNENTQKMLSEVMSVNGATRRAIGDAITTARDSQFLSYIGTFRGQFRITYFALDTENTLRPIEIYELETSKTSRIHREYLERIFGEQGMTWKEIYKGYTCAVLLGGKGTQHNGFAAYLDDITDRLNGR
jgi:hypothetical protein